MTALELCIDITKSLSLLLSAPEVRENIHIFYQLLYFKIVYPNLHKLEATSNKPLPADDIITFG